MALRRDLFILFFFFSLIATTLKAFAGSPTVTADFGSRTQNLPSIPGDLFGIVPGNLPDGPGMNLLAQAGFSHTRRMAQLPQVYVTPTPNWSSFDHMLQQDQAAGRHPLIVMSWTPGWLQPSPNPCTGISNAYNVPPADVQQWAQIAASYVAHVDEFFPGVVQGFEIWNEPDLQQNFCVADNSDATRLQQYLALYAVAASAMHAQAARDGAVIHVGGPTMSRLSLASEWISALVSDPQTAPFVDFVSYHFYLANRAVPWSTLFSIAQGSNGVLSTYQTIANLVSNGSQPNAHATPIYISEYNSTAAFIQDCCRNDPTYAPVLTSVVVADLLNSAHSGVNVPARVYYFAGSVPPFCIVGAWNLNMDCSATEYTPYPQYYAFQLFASPQYLGLAHGGQMAASVSTSNAPPELTTTAFFTPSKDIITIINPTSAAYSQVPVTAQNLGISSPVATEYLLNNSHAHISASSLTVTNAGDHYSMAADIPPYSVVAIAISSGSTSSGSTALPPHASLTLDRQSGSAPLSVTVDSSASRDPNGSIVSRTIDFGDGSAPVMSITASHTYAHPGAYEVLLTVTDNHGLSSKAHVKVQVALPTNSDFILSALEQKAGAGLTGVSRISTYTLTVKPITAVNSPVLFSCSQIPPGVSCTFSPRTVTPGAQPANSVLTLRSDVIREPLTQNLPGGLRLFAALWLLVPGVTLIGRRHSLSHMRRSGVCAFLWLLALALQMGCTSISTNPNSSPGVAAAARNSVMVLASSDTHSHTLVLRLKPSSR